MSITIATANRPGPRVTHNKYVSEETHKICSVFPGPVHLHNHHGDYTIPACGDNEEFASVEIQPGYDKYDLGEDRHIVSLSITSKEVAEDFIGIPAGRTDYIDRGIFVPAGKLPTKEELADARKKLSAWLERQVLDADREYGQRGQARFVDSNARLALKKLGLNRPWGASYTPEETQPCPACKGPMRKGAAIHSQNDREGCGQKVGYNSTGAPYWPDAPASAERVEKVKL